MFHRFQFFDKEQLISAESDAVSVCPFYFLTSVEENRSDMCY